LSHIGKILGSGNIGNDSSIFIQNVVFVEGLKYNLLSISKLYDKDHKVIFRPNHNLICDSKTNKIMLIGKKKIKNIYMLDMEHASSSKIACLVTKNEDSLVITQKDWSYSYVSS